MIFSSSEREHYRKELEAASKAGDTKRVKRLIDQIRLLGDIREDAPKIQKIVLSPANLKGIQEYIKHQSMAKKEKDRKDKPLTHNGLLGYIENMKPPLSKLGEDIFGGEVGTWLEHSDPNLGGGILGDDDMVGFHSPPPILPRSFRDVLRLGFRDNGWTW